MARRTAFLYTDAFLAYDLGGTHPLQQRRLQRVARRLESLGALDTAGGPIALVEPSPAPDAALARVHTPDYLDAVRRAGRGERGDWLRGYGLGPGDTPAFDGMYAAAALYAGGTLDAARLVTGGGFDVAFNVAGGLHHAFPDHASGFCTFNDLALGIHALLDAGCARVAYVDIDAHHGDGVEACFRDEARVLTVSLHESGRWLFPGTGFASDRGGPGAPGSALNLPFAPWTGDAVWSDAFERVVPKALERFAPEALVLQLGADAHFGDPLAHLQLTSRTWIAAVERLLELGAGLPVVVTGGGGYNLDTVERLWTMVALVCAGLPIPDALHDTDRPREIPADAAEAARAYARSQIAELGY